MITFPNAKINIGLFVTGKRFDGYHNIASIFYPIPLHDALEMVPGDAFRFETSGLDIPGNSADNLCIRAYDLMCERHEAVSPVHAMLYKAIPMGAGLGGGSADGAFMINLINTYFNVGLDSDTREKYAAELGSDCPFFIDNTPKMVTGRGEVMQPHALDLTGWYLGLISPDVHVSTKEAYAGIQPAPISMDWNAICADNVSEWHRFGLVNQFESGIAKAHPSIGTAKARLLEAGADYAAMTGSGSSVYGLFREKPEFGGADVRVLEL